MFSVSAISCLFRLFEDEPLFSQKGRKILDGLQRNRDES